MGGWWPRMLAPSYLWKKLKEKVAFDGMGQRRWCWGAINVLSAHGKAHLARRMAKLQPPEGREQLA